ncbi:hypothetical protein ABKV19_017510 [Rosa sericea]
MASIYIIDHGEQFWCYSDYDEPFLITYYHGRLTFNGADFVDVSFMPLEDSIVAQIFERSKKVSHDRVMSPWFFTYDHNIEKSIVCYDRFKAFLPENSPSWLSQPLESSDIPGLPNPTLQREIRELAMGLEHLHNNEVSHLALNSLLSYVWSDGKIKMININGSKFDSWDEGDPSASEKRWRQRKRDHINQFGTTLAYLLKSELVWPERDSFMRCFAPSVSLDRCLKMVYTHPFLMKHMKKILQLFADAHHAYKSQDGGGLNVDLLNSAFQHLGQEYLRPYHGWNRQMGTEFTKIIAHTTPPLPQSSGSLVSTSTGGSFYHHLYMRAPSPPHSGSRRPQSARGTDGYPYSQSGSYRPRSGSYRPRSGSYRPRSGSYRPQSASGSTGHHPSAGTSQPSASTSATAPTTRTPSGKYKTNDMSDLLRFLRNVFQHYYEHKMSLSAFYEEVRKHWPHFVDRIHEKACL